MADYKGSGGKVGKLPTKVAKNVKSSTTMKHPRPANGRKPKGQ